MNERPGLLADSIGDAAVIDTIDLGGGDTIAVTDEATYLYRSEGLLKDESIETFGHTVERVSVRTKRRKSSIRLETIDDESEFTVPSKNADSVLEAMMKGILLTNGVIDADEEITSLFRFSELTLLLTDRRVFEHVGGSVWDDDFEAVDYGDLSGLDFERGSVATQVILETEERRRRVKVPNEHAGTVRREIQEAVCGFYGVDTIEEFKAKTATDEAEPPNDSDTLDSGSNEPSESNADTADPNADGFAGGWSSVAGSSERSRDGSDAETEAEGDRPSNGELKALVDRIDSLSDRIDRQTTLIESQQELLEQLVDELRRGR